MKPLNKHFAPKSVMPEKVIQFGEGNFLRAFVDWIIWNMDQKTNFNGSVVVVQPFEKGMVTGSTARTVCTTSIYRAARTANPSTRWNVSTSSVVH